MFPLQVVVRDLGGHLHYACVECGYSKISAGRITFSTVVMEKPNVIVQTVAVCLSVGFSPCYIALLRRSLSSYVEYFKNVEKMRGGYRQLDDLGDLALSRWSLSLLAGYDYAGSEEFIELWRINLVFFAVLKCMERGRVLIE